MNDVRSQSQVGVAQCSTHTPLLAHASALHPPEDDGDDDDDADGRSRLDGPEPGGGRNERVWGRG